MKRKKPYKLEKTFLNNWIKALKSGKYNQDDGYLLTIHNDKKHYCCMGVACDVLNIDEKILKGETLPWNFHKNINNYNLLPDYFKNDTDDNHFIEFLAALNDKDIFQVHFYAELDNIYIDKKFKKNNSFTFKEIAKIIEDNVEPI